jgi:hypothetical protein
LINQSEIKEHADKLALETGKQIQAVYSEHSGVQYFSAKNNLAENFELLYVTEESEGKTIANSQYSR